MDSAKKEIRYLKDEDCYFIENVMVDIRAYINVLNESPDKNKVLLLPPVNNFRRFLVHQLVEETFSNYNLSTLSIGKLYGRRTVIFPSKLKPMEKNENTAVEKPAVSATNEDPKKKSIPIYRPPAARKRENVVRTSIAKIQERKSRKPDQQIYVPRAKRLNCSQSDESSIVESIQDENKSDDETITKSNVECVESECKRSSYRDEDAVDSAEEVEFVNVIKQDDKVIDTIEIVDNTPCPSITEANIDNKSSDISFNRKKSTDTVISSSVDDENDVPILQPSKDTLIEQQLSSASKEEIEVISLDDSSCQSVDDIGNVSLDDHLTQIEADSATMKPEKSTTTGSKKTDRASKSNFKDFLTMDDSSRHSVYDDIDDISYDERLAQIEAAAATLEPKTPNTPNLKKTDKSGKSSTTSKSLNVDSCDWEELFDESGEYVDHSLIDELMTAIGKVSVQRAAQDYRSFQTAEERSSDGECIIEVYGFPSEFRTENLFDVFTAYRTDRGFQIVWVDDTHALAVFSSPLIADEVLNTQLPFVKTRPLKNAIAKSKMKASNFTLPPAIRPKTCVSLARRLVSGHLGMKIDVTPTQREAERKLLSDAREKKRLMAKQKFDAWEGPSSGEKR